jgi:hypothetical protein
MFEANVPDAAEEAANVCGTVSRGIIYDDNLNVRPRPFRAFNRAR